MREHKHKLITITMLLTIATGIIYIMNRIISASAVLKDLLDRDSGYNYYKWRFGNVYYTKSGHGKPILLIHDILPGSSGNEWSKIEQQLSEQYTVYTLDLLGCGRSDKPKITYTNYIYVELISDFISNVIGEKTSIISSGLSTSATVMACHSKEDIIDKIMLVNPTSLVQLNQVPTKNRIIQKFLLELPIIGTMLYHILVSTLQVENLFVEKYYFNPFHVDRNFMDSYYEAAHLGNSNGKYLYASLVGNYVNLNIVHGLQAIDNSIYIVGGKYEPGIEDIIEDYTHFNPSIESTIIKKAKHFPHMEKPEQFLEQVGIYMN